MNTDQLLALMPFAVATGIEIDRAGPEEVTGRLSWADSIGAVCAFLNLPSGASTSTVSSSTALMRAVRSGHAHAVARPLHVGRSFIVVSVDIGDDDGRRVAQVTQTQAVLGT